jgi:hypothetical protein
MARTVTEISESIRQKLSAELTLSSSGVAEWKLWASVCATAIHVFELILDKFKTDVEDNVMTSRPGTRKWYERLCFLFQNGHPLVWDETAGGLKYETSDPASRITAVANIKVTGAAIQIRVAKRDNEQLVPFSASELANFNNYIGESKPLGTQISVLSRTADSVRYDATVYYESSRPQELMEEQVTLAIDSFKLSQQFGGVLYTARLADALLHVPGVVTAKLNYLGCKGVSDGDFHPVDVYSDLEAGYFNYDKDHCVISFNPI